jgi:hypothetical protein
VAGDAPSSRSASMASPIECTLAISFLEAVQLGARRLADLLEAFSDVFKIAARLG